MQHGASLPISSVTRGSEALFLCLHNSFLMDAVTLPAGSVAFPKESALHLPAFLTERPLFLLPSSRCSPQKPIDLCAHHAFARSTYNKFFFPLHFLRRLRRSLDDSIAHPAQIPSAKPSFLSRRRKYLPVLTGGLLAAIAALAEEGRGSNEYFLLPEKPASSLKQRKLPALQAARTFLQ